MAAQSIRSVTDDLAVRRRLRSGAARVTNELPSAGVATIRLKVDPAQADVKRNEKQVMEGQRDLQSARGDG